MNLQQDIAGIAREMILVLAALFPIVNPLGSAAIFINMAGPLDSKLHELVSRKISIYSFFLLMVSMIWGAKVLSFFGISIYAVQIGGGLVVTIAGWSLLNQANDTQASTPADPEGALDKAFYPYTLPLTVGPGSISVAITLGAHLTESLGHGTFLAPQVLIPALVGVVSICVIIYICYRYGRSAERLLGKTGTTVVMRLSSFILLCIGIQIVSTGVRTYLELLRGH